MLHELFDVTVSVTSYQLLKLASDGNFYSLIRSNYYRANYRVLKIPDAGKCLIKSDLKLKTHF